QETAVFRRIRMSVGQFPSDGQRLLKFPQRTLVTAKEAQMHRQVVARRGQFCAVLRRGGPSCETPLDVPRLLVGLKRLLQAPDFSLNVCPTEQPPCLLFPDGRIAELLAAESLVVGPRLGEEEPPHLQEMLALERGVLLGNKEALIDCLLGLPQVRLG